MATAKTPASPGTGTPTEADTEDTKKPTKEKEIPVIHDQGFFQHETGDTYDGYFEAKKKDRVVKMHGPGVYTTAEGDSYTGNWEADKFGGNEEVVIAFADGSKYEGTIKEWAYASNSRYTYPDGSVLQGEFIDNCPVGHLTLTDPNGHTWLGTADQGFAWFEPVNHFYEFLETTRDPSNKLKKRHKNVLQDPSSMSKGLVDTIQ
uniref:MORN repeat-containing protein 5 n=1 Tax=Heliothis virescens TaxID=7102 RepID=A0A2A4KBC5_HELVI